MSSPLSCPTRSHFVKLGAPDEELAAKSIRELEAHSQVGPGMHIPVRGSACSPGADGTAALHHCLLSGGSVQVHGGACELRPAPLSPALPCCTALSCLPKLAVPCIPPSPQIMDLLGFEPSPWNKINIHIGG